MCRSARFTLDGVSSIRVRVAAVLAAALALPVAACSGGKNAVDQGANSEFRYVQANKQGTVIAADKRKQAGPLAGVLLSGGDYKLSEDRGKIVVLNFFASWCGPCQRETPLLAGFYRSHHGQLAVVGIDANDRSAKAIEFLREKRASYPVAFDPHASVATLYGVLDLPQTFFLNARHQIVRHIIGGVTARELASWATGLRHDDSKAS